MEGTDTTLRTLLPDDRGQVDPAAAYAYPDGLTRPWVRANMVQSVDGAAWGSRGRSGELSSPADRAVLATLRGLSDVILVGAATVRAEGYRPVRPREVWAALRRGRPATPPIAVVTRSVDLDPELLAAAPDDARTLVFTCRRAPEDRRRAAARHADVVVAGEESVDPRAVVAELARRRLLRVLCEGGPHLLGELTSADLVDELCLTLSAVLAGPGASRIVAGRAAGHGAGAPASMRLAQLLCAESDPSTLFLRYERADPAQAASRQA